MCARKSSAYQPLTESDAIALVKRLMLFEDTSQLTCNKIGDGNLYLNFHVKETSTGNGYMIKQALPYTKIISESWPFPIDRTRIEDHALLKQRDIAPAYVPKVYYSDVKLGITIIEDLSHLHIARKALVEGSELPLLSTHLGAFLGKTLFYTSIYAHTQHSKNEIDRHFSNPDRCKNIEEFDTTDPLFEHETFHYEPVLKANVEKILQDKLLKLEVSKLKEKFLKKPEALIHGNLHTGNILVSEHETKVIDEGFAYFGPIAFDVGQVFGHFLLNILSRDLEEQAFLFQHLITTWNVFVEEFSKAWKKDASEIYTANNGYLEHILSEIFTDAVGFAGCELIRYTIWHAHGTALDTIQTYDKKITVKQLALSLGYELVIKQKNITKPVQFIQYVKQTIANRSQHVAIK
ncbi:S-methyl-5-thioribose kinase [Bacillus sp. 7586-K]|nr:S-methyl-5-thioribose kinase [Bacillus sp. 7586-K]